jgi:hypothetical protein
MTQEDKALLLKDIYARIPYGVKGCCEGETLNTTPLCWYAEHTLEYSVNYMVIKNGWRPYLFPMSSMTEEQNDSWRDAFLNDLAMSATINYPESEKYLALSHFKSIEWLYKHHFDVNGLIEKGLALDATG